MQMLKIKHQNKLKNAQMRREENDRLRSIRFNAIVANHDKFVVSGLEMAERIRELSFERHEMQNLQLNRRIKMR